MKSQIPIKIINPSAWNRTSYISIDYNNHQKISSLSIYNEKNQEITCQISPDNKNQLKIQFIAEDIPANNFLFYTIKSRDPNAELHLPQEALLDGNDYYLENDRLRIIVEENGTFTIMEKIENSNSTDEKEKLIIMGEELGDGSIWAKDSFFYYYNLFQLSLNSHKLNVDSLKIKLLEANDFFGLIEAVHEYSNDLDQKIKINTHIKLEKGSNSLISFTSKIYNLPNHSEAFIIFPTPFSSANICTNNGFIYNYDKNNHNGLAIFTKNGIFESVISSNGKIMVKIPIRDHDFDGENNLYNLKICLLTITNLDLTNEEEQIKYLQKYYEEWSKPLQYKIEY